MHAFDLHNLPARSIEGFEHGSCPHERGQARHQPLEPGDRLADVPRGRPAAPSGSATTTSGRGTTSTPIFGDPDQPIFEGYTALAALAQATERIRLGPVRRRQHVPQPGPRGRSRWSTIDHISGGRAILGIGGAWFEDEHRGVRASTSGPASGSASTGWPRPSPAIRALLDGGEVTSPPGGRYAFDELRIAPPPVQRHLPIMIGGAGEKKTLRIVAEHADMWNVFGTPETVADKDADPARALRGRRPRLRRRSSGRSAARSTIRDDRGRGRARRTSSSLGHNRTPTSRIDGRRHVLDGNTGADRGDDAGATGGSASTPSSCETAGAVRPRDDGAPDRRGQADGRAGLRPLASAVEPGVGRRVAEQLTAPGRSTRSVSRPVTGRRRRHVREDLGHQLGARPGACTCRPRRRSRHARRRRRPSSAARTARGDVPRVDVAPQVPLPDPRRRPATTGTGRSRRVP